MRRSSSGSIPIPSIFTGPVASTLTPGRLVSRSPGNKTLEVADDTGETFTVDESKAVFVSEASLRRLEVILEGSEDMTTLGDFNEGTLLHNVRLRYLKNDIYTSIGSAILLAVNPYCRLDLYGDEQRARYRGKLAAEFVNVY